MSGSDAVPFGKYKGRPVEDMLADQAYMAWISAQPWFRDKFGHLMTEKDKQAAERTPVHNRLQALFLKANYLSAFRIAIGLDAKLKTDLSRMREKTDRHLTESIRDFPADSDWPDHLVQMVRDRDILNENGSAPSVSSRVMFEHKGSDVFIESIYSISYWESDPTWRGIRQYTSQHEFNIEIKPHMGDDYPVVLRQMNKNGSRYLFLAEFEAEGVTLDDVISMFYMSNKIIVMKSEVDVAFRQIADQPL